MKKLIIIALITILILTGNTYINAKQNVIYINMEDFFTFDTQTTFYDGCLWDFYIPYPIFDLENKKVYFVVPYLNRLSYYPKETYTYIGGSVYEWNSFEDALFNIYSSKKVDSIYASREYIFVLFSDGTTYGLYRSKHNYEHSNNVFEIDDIIRNNGGIKNVYKIIPGGKDTLIIIFKNSSTYIHKFGYPQYVGTNNIFNKLEYSPVITNLIKSKGGPTNIYALLHDYLGILIIFKDGTIYGIGHKTTFGYNNGIFETFTRLTNIENEINKHGGIENINNIILFSYSTFTYTRGILFIMKDGTVIGTSKNGIHRITTIENYIKQGYKPLESTPYILEKNSTYIKIWMNNGYFTTSIYKNTGTDKILKSINVFDITQKGKIIRNGNYGWTITLPTNNIIKIKSSVIWSKTKTKNKITIQVVI